MSETPNHVTKIIPPYKAAHFEGGPEYEHQLTLCRFYGVIERPKLRGSVMSPSAIRDHLSRWTLSQQMEAEWWVGEDWYKERLQEVPSNADGISIEIDGFMRITNKRVISIIGNDGTNQPFSGELEVKIREGDSEFSRIGYAPSLNFEGDAYGESLSISCYVTRAQLEFLRDEISRGDVGLSLMLEAYGFQWGPERSHASFEETQKYFLEHRAIVMKFDLSTVPVAEIAAAREDRDHKHSELETTRKGWVDEVVRSRLSGLSSGASATGEDTDEPEPLDLTKTRHSEYRRALDAISTAAMRHAEAQSAAYGSDGMKRFERLFDEATSFIDNFEYAVEGRQDYRNSDTLEARTRAEELRLWSHRSHPFYDIKIKKTPDLNRVELEQVVERYLELPFRAAFIDRLLVDLLVVTEIYAYADATINAPRIPGLTPTTPLTRKPSLEWLQNVVITVLLCCGIGWSLWGLSLIHFFPEDWVDGVVAILLLLGVIGVAWSTVVLPFAWRETARGKRQISDLLTQMNGVYAELASEGSISAHHIDQRARSASEAGVVWPGPLFVLLDDVRARGGRF